MTDRKPLLIAAAAVLALAAPAATSGKTISVSPSNPDCTGAQTACRTIAGAAAVAADGDTIEIAAGTYGEVVAFGQRDLTIKGAGSVVQAAAGDPALTFTATTGETKVDGLAVVNSGGPGLSFGGGTNLLSHLLVEGTDAIVFASSSSSVKNLLIDSSLLQGGANGAAVRATSTGAPLTTPGAMTIALRHVTVAAGKSTLALDASGSAVAAGGAIDASLTDTIALPPSTTTAAAPNPLFAAGTITGPLLVRSDTTSSAASLFVGAANPSLRADSPAIGKGRSTPGEAATDLLGRPLTRADGSSDLGAIQFVDRPPTAVVTASAAAARENGAITFSASGSADPDTGGSVVQYVWSFGDGTMATGPTVAHAWARRGTYAVTLAVVDNNGLAGIAAATVTILDGTPPKVVISSPRAKQKLTLLKKTTRTVTVKRKGKKPHKRKRTTTTRRQVVLFGNATDDSKVAAVFVALRRGKKAGNGKCAWYDGKAKFASRACDDPRYLRAALVDGQWRLTLPVKAKLATGSYQLVVRAVDGTGLASAPTTVAFTLR